MKKIGDYNAITPLERVKHDIAEKEGFDTWRDLTFKVNGLSLELIMDKVAEELASLKVSEAKQLPTNNVTEGEIEYETVREEIVSSLKIGDELRYSNYNKAGLLLTDLQQNYIISKK